VGGLPPAIGITFKGGIMTTIELCAELMKRDPTWHKQVILSSDEEGNSFSTVCRDSIFITPTQVVLYPWKYTEIKEE
jgi:hypothetical protein